MKEIIPYEDLLFSSFYNTQLQSFILRKQIIENTSTIDMQEFKNQMNIQTAYPILASEISEFLFSVIWLRAEDPKLSNITPAKLGIADKYGCDKPNQFLRHLRNAISHKRCVFYKDGSATFYDQNSDNSPENFRVELDAKQFALLKDEFRNLAVAEFLPKAIKTPQITEVRLGCNVFLGDYAFCGNVNMQRINLPSHITKIPDWAFCNCTSLKCVCLPMKVSSIGKRAFSGCSKLQIFPYNWNYLKSIGDYAFADCNSLEHFTLLSDTKVGRRAFSGWNANQTITIIGDKNDTKKWADDWCENCDAIVEWE